MNANAVRVHALMPPDFYRALYNINQGGSTLWLIQGVELTDQVFSGMTDMLSGKMVALFTEESSLVINAIHGNKRTLGYVQNVSPFAMAYIVGDHWNSDLILYTDHVAADIAGKYSGRYASVWETANATPTLLAEVFNNPFSYETRKYCEQHIVGLGNTQRTDMVFYDVSWAK